MKKLELLSPAKDLLCGIAAINHGADAVYIGASRFGARKSAGNSIQDIEKLASYAGRFNAQVYLTLNTILFDHEIKEAEKIAKQAWEAGVSALIVQDMAFMEMDLPPLRLFASTQTDNRSPEKVLFLEKAGFDRVILARELSLGEIRKIRSATNIDLEAFVHGAVCYSFSGRCYMSAHIGGRSANRGECGQPCRLKWSLKKHDGEVLIKDKHLLSLKDMDRSGSLEELIESGITSFKIEGRLKDEDYVKNITSFYRKRLDAIMEERRDLRPSSSGRTSFFFDPDPKRTFNRGLHSFFPEDKAKETVFSINTPKSMGKRIGKIKKTGHNYMEVETDERIANGDGICFIDENGSLKGFMVERAEGLKIYVSSDTTHKIEKGTVLYRNRDHEFLKTLSSHRTSERKIALDLTFYETPEGFALAATDEDCISARVSLECEKIQAEKPGQALSNIEAQISKLGDSIFYKRSLEIRSAPYFIQVKNLNQLRRDLMDEMEKARSGGLEKEIPLRLQKNEDNPEGSNYMAYPEAELDFSSNVSNQKANDFYLKHGAKKIEPAFELSKENERPFVMHSKHCILKNAGLCHKNRNKARLIIEEGGHGFEIITDCERCEMYLKVLEKNKQAP